MNADFLKPALGRLAARLATDEDATLLAQLQTLNLVAATLSPATPAPAAAPARPAAPVRQFGIWDLQPDGSLVRSRKAYADWRYWADLPTIPAKSAKRRIVYLGESVARGYLYDPALTPAQFLAASLDGADGVEVIDAARTDLRPKDLLDLLRRVPVLQPDAIVVFAGNNWHYGEMLSPTDLIALADAAAGGPAAMRQVFLRHHLRHVARTVMGALAQMTKTFGIPVVFVIPGFNLADWIDDAPLPYLGAEPNTRWEALRTEALAALEAEHYAAVEALAHQMLALDAGLSPLPHRLLGRACAAAGRKEEAQRHFQAAADALCGLPYASAPRCPGVLQDALRTEARAAGVAIVDVPQLLSAAESIPGKQWFMDYCHHSAEGLARVLSRVAETLAPAVPGLSLRADRPTRYSVGASDAAMAHFLAAIHNSQFNQPEGILEYHCLRALELDPGIAKVMQAFLTFRTTAGHDWLHASFRTFCGYSNAQRYMFKDAPHKSDKRLTFGLYRAISHALRESAAPEPVAAPLLEPAPAEAARRGEPLDLLLPAHRLRSAWGQEDAAAFFVAHEPVSEFWLLRDRSAGLSLQLCCRIVGPERTLTVTVDGVAAGRATVGSRWTKVAFEVPPGAAASRIAIAWPPLAAGAGPAPHAIQSALERGALPDVFPVYGSIFEFVARPHSNQPARRLAQTAAAEAR
jgi:hypothetical protein